MRPIIEMRKKIYNISDADRIKYQLHKQIMTLSELLRKRDDAGNDRTDNQIISYNSEKNKDARDLELARYESYMSKKMPSKAYTNLCKRLHINEEPDLFELEQIKIWYEKLNEKGIEFKKRPKDFKVHPNKQIKNTPDYTKPSKRLTAKRMDALNGVEETAKDIFLSEDEQLLHWELELDNYQKQEFIEYTKKLPRKIILVWYKYKHFFNVNHTDELLFLKEYVLLNDFGKKVIHEFLLWHFTEEELSFSDERIKLYENMKRITLSIQIDNLDAIENEIWDTWASYCDKEDIKLRKEIAEILLNCTEQDFHCLMDYYRLQLFSVKEDAHIEKMKYFDFINSALCVLFKVPCLKK